MNSAPDEYNQKTDDKNSEHHACDGDRLRLYKKLEYNAWRSGGDGGGDGGSGGDVSGGDRGCGDGSGGGDATAAAGGGAGFSRFAWTNADLPLESARTSRRCAWPCKDFAVYTL